MWREHVRYNRVMLHSDILKKLDTLLLYTEVKFWILQRVWKECRCSACSKQPEEKKKTVSIRHPWAVFILQPVHRQSCSHGNRNDEFSNISALQSWHVKLVGHLHIIISKKNSLEAQPRISSFLPKLYAWGSVGILQNCLSDFPRILIALAVSLNGRLSNFKTG